MRCASGDKGQLVREEARIQENRPKPTKNLLKPWLVRCDAMLRLHVNFVFMKIINSQSSVSVLTSYFRIKALL